MRPVLHYDRPLGTQVIGAGPAATSILMLPDYQIRIARDGAFHRRGAIDGECACGAVIPDMHATRDYVLDDKLCPECFTRHELDLGARATAERERAKYPVDDPGEPQ